MSEAFSEMRKQALRRLARSNGSVPPNENLRFEWKVEVMDRIEAIERFLDRDDED
jgi:hypothetical protein